MDVSGRTMQEQLSRVRVRAYQFFCYGLTYSQIFAFSAKSGRVGLMIQKRCLLGASITTCFSSLSTMLAPNISRRLTSASMFGWINAQEHLCEIR